MIAVVAASTLVAYIIYCMSPETTEKFGTRWLVLTMPFPIYGIFRYLYIVHRKDGGGKPSAVLLTDRPLARVRRALGPRGSRHHLSAVRVMTRCMARVRRSRY